MMKKTYSHKYILFLAVLGWLSFSAFDAKSQITVIVDQPLHFGRFVLADFSGVETIQIRTNGTFTATGNIYHIIDPTRGEYTLDAPSNANSSYSISVPASFSFGGGPGGSFTLDNITVRPNSLVTDGIGQDQFRLTGELHSAGGGVVYNDGTYSDSFTITVNF